MTLTCAMGNFIFDGGVSLSKMKKIRDEVMGQFFTPKPGLPRLNTRQDIESFVRNEHHMRDVASIPFEVTITNRRNNHGDPV